MVTTTLSYVMYTPGHRRHHAGSQVQLLPTATGFATAGDSLTFVAFPSLIYNETVLPFAFMSIVGSADGNNVYTEPGAQTISVGDADIKVLVVYAPVGGGDGGPGALVDAFNVDTGEFSDSDFMQVFTNGSLDAAKTATANEDGFVSSATAEDMRSLTAVDSLPFLEWHKVGSLVVNTIDYNLQKEEGGLIFAFYKAVKSTNPSTHLPDLPNISAGWIYLSPGVLVDGGGIGWRPGGGGPHPIDPWGPLYQKLTTTLALVSLSTHMDEEVRNMALDLAEQHLASIGKSLKTTRFDTGSISTRGMSGLIKKENKI